MTTTLNLDRELAAIAENAVNLRRFGVLGNGVKEESAVIKRAIDAAIDEGIRVLFIPRTDSFYRCESAINITGSIWIVSNGATVRQMTSATKLFNVSGSFSGLGFHGLRIIGEHDTTTTTAKDTNEVGIDILATDASNQIDDIRISRCLFRGWDGIGLRIRHCNDIEITRCRFRNIHYAGASIESCRLGVFSNNRIKGINGSQGDNAYGGIFSRQFGSEATHPRTSDWTVSLNVVEDVPNWEAFDSKGSKNMMFTGNSIFNCAAGFTVAHSEDGSSNILLAPQNVNIIGNTMESNKTAQDALRGITFAGGTNTAGSPVELGTGSIIGNTIKRYGQDAADSFRGAIYIYGTKGMNCTQNTMIECSTTGVLLDFDNYGINVSDNAFVDVHQEDGVRSAICIEIRDNYNEVTFDGNKSDSRDYTPGGSGSVNDVGISVKDHSTVVVDLGDNDFEDCTTPLSDAGLRAKRCVQRGFTELVRGIGFAFADVNNANLSLTTAHCYLAVTTSTTAVTLTLPATHVAGQTYIVRDKGGTITTRAITIGRNGNNINGSAADYTFNTPNLGTLIIVSNGSGWFTSRIVNV